MNYFWIGPCLQVGEQPAHPRQAVEVEGAEPLQLVREDREPDRDVGLRELGDVLLTNNGK